MFSWGHDHISVSLKRFRPDIANLKRPPVRMPVKTGTALAPPLSPAMSTLAQAAPSGKGRFSCSVTTSEWRSGIIMSMPRMPPAVPSRNTFPLVISPPMKRMAGTVKMMAAASDSPLEAIECTIMFSRIVPSRLRMRGRIMRSTPIEMIADGMEAETVKPIFRPR